MELTGDHSTPSMTETIGRPTRLREPEEPPPQIPDYHFVKIIGRGAFGTVWLAEETMAGVYRAIKVLRPRRVRSPQAAPASDSASDSDALKPTDRTAEPAVGSESGFRALDPPTSTMAADPWAWGAKPQPRRAADSAQIEPRDADGAAQDEPRIEEHQRRPSLVDRELEGIHAYQALAKDHAHLIRILKTGLCKIVEETPLRPPLARGEAGGSHTAVYYVMEIADHAGGAQPHHLMDYQPLSLATLLRQRGRLPVTSLVRSQSLVRSRYTSGLLAPASIGVLESATALLDAIEHLHKAGLQHRDVKPSNILFVNGVLKLADLGLAASDESDEPVGTPGYLPPPPPDAEPSQRHGAPDDLYALGKVMYELTTGLPAVSFPDWPADLDPKADLLLAPLRELVNKLCHPVAANRLGRLADARRSLRATASPSRAALARGRLWVALTGIAMIAAVAGVWGSRWWFELADPMHRALARPPYDGAQVSESLGGAGYTVTLFRDHSPGVAKSITSGEYTVVELRDIQTRLGEARDYNTNQMKPSLIVAVAYRIYNRRNPVTGDAAKPKGEIDQLYLAVGDGADANFTLLYHAQPGPYPGTQGRVVRWVALEDLPIAPSGGSKIRLILRSAATPQQAESELRSNFEKHSESSVVIGQIGRAPSSATGLGIASRPSS